MQTVFAGFKQCLGKLRRTIEDSESFNFRDLNDYFYENDVDDFYSRLILLRTREYFGINAESDECGSSTSGINKKSVLRMLSIWETDL